MLMQYDPKKTAVMLTYAEIDIRNHIFKQMAIKRLSIEEACSIVVDRYKQAIHEIEKLGFTKILINGPFGSGFGVPRVGSENIRNFIAFKLHTMLEEASSKNNWLYQSLIEIMLDSKYHINREYFGEIDDNHLNKSKELCFYILAGFLKSARSNGYWPTEQTHQMNDRFNYVLFNNSDQSPNVLNSSIINNKFIHITDQCKNFNQLIISLDDHVFLKSVRLGFNDHRKSKEIYCKIRLLDSQFKILHEMISEIKDNAIIMDSSSGVWCWYVELIFEEPINSNVLSDFEFSTIYHN